MSKKHPIQLSDHFTYARLFRFVLPSIVMMVFTSIYGVVDGLFVSNFAGKTAFASINLIMPFLVILGALGFMLGTGGTALVSRVLGEGDKERANKYFSMITLFGILLGVIENLSMAYISTQLSDAIVFLVLVVVLIVKPTGLLGKKVNVKV